MSDAIKGLKPELLWSIFEDLTRIPRCSGNEAKVAEYFNDKAEAAGYETRSDAVGNMVVVVPATPGYEDAPVVILQGHLDMVCTKNAEVQFDFSADAIRMVREGDWIKADGTTLGADNGIGLAAALAVAMSKDVVHGPLELLMTVDEETGLTGAMGLGGDMLTGHILLNLDSEDSGVICMGCAGGSGVDSYLPLEYTPPSPGYEGALIKVTGLRGGHSGIDIHENRGNAIKVLARILGALSGRTSFEIGDFNAGDKHNAIPREGNVLLALPSEAMEAASALVKSQNDAFRTEYPEDANLAVTFDKADLPAKVWTAGTSLTAVRLLVAFPYGVQTMSREMQGLVETSNNLAIARVEGDEFYIHNSPRSSLAEAIRGALDQLHAAAKLGGARTVEEEAYPGWQPNPESKILRLLEEVYYDLFKEKAERLAYHAGLECGIIGEKFEGMDMASFGPTIVNPHSPDEAVQVETVEKFWLHLAAALEAIAKGAYK